MFWFFDDEECGILAPRPGIESASSALEGEILTTGQPGKSKTALLKASTYVPGKIKMFPKYNLRYNALSFWKPFHLIRINIFISDGDMFF